MLFVIKVELEEGRPGGQLTALWPLPTEMLFRLICIL